MQTRNVAHFAFGSPASRASLKAFNRSRFSWKTFWARSCSVMALAASASLNNLRASRSAGRNYLPFKCVAHCQPLIPMSLTLRACFSADSVSSAPAASATKPATYQPQDQQKHNGSNEGVYDQSNHTYPEVDAKSRQ
jgi:hypothetical protein